VLEVAAGTGVNLGHYPAGIDIVFVDLSPSMLARARSRGAPKVVVMDAGQLAIRDGSFDTVVSTLGTCTFPDPVEALREMRRVCRPGGRILLLEHGRSSRPRVAAWQDRRAAKHAGYLGCWWNREPREAVRLAGLDVAPHRRWRDYSVARCLVLRVTNELHSIAPDRLGPPPYSDRVGETLQLRTARCYAQVMDTAQSRSTARPVCNFRDCVEYFFTAPNPPVEVISRMPQGIV
jgi:SAM-dependent methyltransferase